MAANLAAATDYQIAARIERLPLSSTNKLDRAELKREAETRLTNRA